MISIVDIRNFSLRRLQFQRIEQTMNSTPTSDDAAGHFARHLDAFFAPLAVLLVARFRLLGLWAVPILNRLNRSHRRLTTLLAHLAAGRAFRSAAPRSRAPHSGGPPPIRLPARRGWLVILLRHEAAVFMIRLEAALNDPATIALLAANPAAAHRIARTLRPLCHLLGVIPAFALPARPKRRRNKPRAALPAPQKSPTRQPARSADGYLIPPSAAPPAWPPVPRIAPNLLPPLMPTRNRRQRDHAEAGTKLTPPIPS